MSSPRQEDPYAGDPPDIGRMNHAALVEECQARGLPTTYEEWNRRWRVMKTKSKL